MNYEITATADFERNLKRLSKKYFSLSDDYGNFLKELLENPKSGDDLGGNIRKVRMAIASKNRGKSGGARITCNFWVDEVNAKIYLLTVYDRGEQAAFPGKKSASLNRQTD
jgi:mRNA-degrading endonuclease RelE of RelBE toxin-antitoxin system